MKWKGIGKEVRVIGGQAIFCKDLKAICPDIS